MIQPPQPPSIPKVAIVVGVVLALVVTGLWAAYKYWSPEKAGEITRLVAVLVGALVAALVLIYLFWRIALWMKESKAQRQEEQAVARKPSMDSGEQAELQELQEKVNAAAQVLRESKLARGKTAEEALYTLPWVMLLGPPESGKTTLLRECGVDFPYTTMEMQKFARKGEPSGCEFWFSREGIILDLAGRLATETSETELLGSFLDQLKRVRRARPIDGVAVAISVKEILDSSSDQLEKLANGIRQRLDLLIRRLGIRFPIYILFTKCDQIDGFKEFFANMRSRDRAQVWGATISRAQRKRLTATQIFQQEFDRLVESLYQLRLQLMATESDSAHLPQIFTFPAQLAGQRDKIAAFIGALLEPTPYSERPLFRGFYLSSAAPQEVAVDSRQAPQRWDAVPYRVAAPEEPPKPSKVFFLESLLPEVIFADRPLATASVDRRLKRRLIHDIALAATVVLCAFLLGVMTYSFVNNSRLVTQIDSTTLPMLTAGWNGRSGPGLRSLEALRRLVEETGKYESEGPPLSMRWGLYSGEDSPGPIRRLYARKLRESYLSAAGENIRQLLYSMAARSQSIAYNDFYNNLKTYLLMTIQPSEPTPEEWALNNGLEGLWKKLAPQDSEGIDLALSQLRYYAHRMLQKDPDLILPRDEVLVTRVRQALKQFSRLEREYTRLKNEGNAKLRPFTLEQATGGKTEYLASTRDVPGVFTEPGWHGYFKGAIEQVSKSVMQNDWVVGIDAGASVSQTLESGYEGKMREWYFAEYAEEWSKFLEGISIRPLTDIMDAKNALDLFSQQDASVSRLLQNVAANTMLRKELKQASPGTGAAPSGPTALQRLTRSETIEAVSDKFAPLHEVAASLDGKLPPQMAQYFDALGRIRSQLQSLIETGAQGEMLRNYASRVTGSGSSDDFREAYRVAQKIRQTCGTSRFTNPVGSLLEQPIRQAWASLLRDMMGNLDARWKTQIAESYRREVESQYPFNPNGQDLPLNILTKYFKQGDGLIWAFYDKELKAYMTSDSAGPAGFFTLKPNFTREFLDFIERARAIRDAFYSLGGNEPGVSFDLTPEGTTDVTESILEVDGQPQLRYRNELPSPQSFGWPGKPGPPQARISIAITSSSERPNIPPIPGDWAFFRLLQKATVEVQSANSYRITWAIPSSDPRKFVVRYRLQARNATNPFAPGFFRDMRCPDRLVQAGLGLGMPGSNP